MPCRNALTASILDIFVILAVILTVLQIARCFTKSTVLRKVRNYLFAKGFNAS